MSATKNTVDPTQGVSSGMFFPEVWSEDGSMTDTARAERETEEVVRKQMKISENKPVRLGYDAHRAYSSKGLTSLPGYVGYLDASRTWLSFWMSNSLDLLGFPLNAASIPRGTVATPPPHHIIEFLDSCFVTLPDGVTGGFAGGPNQIPHLAPTYSATLALLTIGTPEAYKVLETKRDKLLRWFTTLKNTDGSVVMHEGGEIDVRGCYCMMLPAVLLGIDTAALRDKMGDFIVSCQSYEGGFGCQPYEEAHGGYTFCATAALSLLRENSKANLKSLSSWLAKRQCASQGGFNGRTNKLVDACYSFWVGAAHSMLKGWEAEVRVDPTTGGPKNIKDALLLDTIAFFDFDTYNPTENEITPPAPIEAVEGSCKEEDSDWDDVDQVGMLNCDQTALQNYILRCCQAQGGGLRDKPGVGPDYYHTCYALAGLSISQGLNKEHHLARYGEQSLLRSAADFSDPSPAPPASQHFLTAALKNLDESASPVYTADPSSCVTRLINPVFSIRRERAVSALRYFRESATIPKP